MSTSSKQVKSPVVLGHAACTGGSLVFRVLVATFDLYGLNEIGLAKVQNDVGFNPWDPELQLFRDGKTSAAEFDNELINRVRRCHQKLDLNGQRMLFREHTHSYFFNPIETEIVPVGGAWLVDAYRERFQEGLASLVSVRNPIDSWLGFRRSFERQLPSDFDAYCACYNNFLDKIEHDNRDGFTHHLFKYEDLIEDPQKQIDSIARHIGEPERDVDLSLVGATIGSGNSGRRSSTLKINKRRGFSKLFVRESQQSAEYKKLAARLDYPLLNDELELVDKIRAQFYSGTYPVKMLLQRVETPARWFYELLKSGKNIQ